jgi:hypothetical protein
MGTQITREDEAVLLAVLEWHPIEAPVDQLPDRAEYWLKLPDRQYQQEKARLLATKQAARVN